MLTLAQKLVALGAIALIELSIFLFSPILGVIGLLACAPLAFAILTQ